MALREKMTKDVWNYKHLYLFTLREIWRLLFLEVILWLKEILFLSSYSAVFNLAGCCSVMAKWLLCSQITASQARRTKARAKWFFMYSLCLNWGGKSFSGAFRKLLQTGSWLKQGHTPSSQIVISKEAWDCHIITQIK